MKREAEDRSSRQKRLKEVLGCMLASLGITLASSTLCKGDELPQQQILVWDANLLLLKELNYLFSRSCPFN